MGEKFAIITDIHGNSAALKAVLEDIKRDKDIGQIYCLGDMIAIGHETNQVLELLFSEKNISFVMGNHEQSVLNIILGKPSHSQGIVQMHHEWIAKNLDEAYVERLANIPKQITTEIAGKKVLFLHYHLDCNNQFLPLDTDPTGPSLEKIYENTDVDLVCFGHHHTIHHFSSKSRMYLNPGPLGCSHKPLAPYGTIEIGENGQVNVHIKEVPYDNRAFLKSIFETKYPAYETVLEVFYGNQHIPLVEEEEVNSK
ncbi:metallophosphoesterase family protein [Ornithinibacillus sp. BX22]|uniref:Metallophosphoesterase family protein n=1 Tax=Ornithinibacillus hominis TaxID=2763055 RepID=A0A923RKK7_9BACI|nr:metallophosphoesterase family protein [Ornithinibacillus hominis]MBC5637327.1 metallophosphoesterase family protein [Ornithinibacillus hominis]